MDTKLLKIANNKNSESKNNSVIEMVLLWIDMPHYKCKVI